MERKGPGGSVALSGRLRMLADMVTPGSRLVDVGCDHGFLSIYLVQEGACPTVLAMDVREGPLAAAKRHVEAYGLGEYITLRLSDGLGAYRAGEAEALVCAGPLVLEEAKDYGAKIYPVDSEHSALFQCLEANRDRGEVKRLILTCSGGPFYGKKRGELVGITVEDALKHPNWSMGAKITVDSATLMNKGLEVIEAMHLYRMPAENFCGGPSGEYHPFPGGIL